MQIKLASRFGWLFYYAGILRDPMNIGTGRLAGDSRGQHVDNAPGLHFRASCGGTGLVVGRWRYQRLVASGLARVVKTQKGQPDSGCPFCFQLGAPGEIRTPYPLVRSQVLYPDELRAHFCCSQKVTLR